MRLQAIAKRWLPALLILVGAGLRLSHFLTPRALWLDEAMLAVSLLTRDWTGLMQPLEYFQSAPLGWLWLVWGGTQWLGTADWVLRLWPLLASVATLPLLYALYRQWGNRWLAATGLGAAALTYILIFFSSEVKPYQTDVLASTLLLLAATRWPLSRSRTWGLAILGCCLPWLSLPSVLVLAAIGVAWLRKQVQAGLTCWPVLGVGSLWLLSAWLHLHLRPSSAAGMAFMQVFWQDDMLWQGLSGEHGLHWLAVHALDPFESWTVVALPVALGLALLAAWGAWYQRSGEQAILIIGPVVLAGLLSALELYALRGRVLLFALPGLWYWVAAGADDLRRRLPSQGQWIVPLGLWVAVGLPAVSELAQQGNLEPRQALPDALHWVADHHQPGQQVYVHHESVPAARIYAPRILPPSLPWEMGSCYMLRWDGCIRPACLDVLFAQNWQLTWSDLSTYHGEVWVLFSHVPYTSVAGHRKADALLTEAVLSCGGECLQRHHFKEALALLYRLP
jgi:hypothetical protein